MPRRRERKRERELLRALRALAACAQNANANATRNTDRVGIRIRQRICLSVFHVSHRAGAWKLEAGSWRLRWKEREREKKLNLSAGSLFVVDCSSAVVVVAALSFLFPSLARASAFAESFSKSNERQVEKWV